MDVKMMPTKKDECEIDVIKQLRELEVDVGKDLDELVMGGEVKTLKLERDSGKESHELDSEKKSLNLELVEFKVDTEENSNELTFYTGIENASSGARKRGNIANRASKKYIGGIGLMVLNILNAQIDGKLFSSLGHPVVDFSDDENDFACLRDTDTSDEELDMEINEMLLGRSLKRLKQEPESQMRELEAKNREPELESEPETDSTDEEGRVIYSSNSFHKTVIVFDRRRKVKKNKKEKLRKDEENTTAMPIKNNDKDYKKGKLFSSLGRPVVDFSIQEPENTKN